ncbi:MAG: ribosome recycling factor [Buchnera aphidicola (Chaetogeoica yunlongensis)]
MHHIKQFTISKMDNCIKVFLEQLNTLRSSRVSPSILDSIFIDYLGQKVQLKKLSNIVVDNFNTLKVTLFDNSIKHNAEKAIMNSKLDLTPIFIKDYFKITIPVLTEERRVKLIKLSRNMAENSRICIRNIRRISNEKIKLLFQDKIIGNDTERSFQDIIQRITDKYISKINVTLNKKEKDLMII